MGNKTIEEKNIINKLCEELNLQLNIDVSESIFKKYNSYMGDVERIQTHGPISLVKGWKLAFLIMNNTISFTIEKIEKVGMTYTIYSHDYFKYISSEGEYVCNAFSLNCMRWIVSSIGEIINSNDVIVLVSRQGETSVYDKINLKEVLNE